MTNQQAHPQREKVKQLLQESLNNIELLPPERLTQAIRVLERLNVLYPINNNERPHL